MKGDFFLKVNVSSIPELVQILLEHTEELRLSKKDDHALVEAKGLDMDEALSSRFAILYPEAEIDVMIEGKKERFEPDLPAILKGVLSCPNPNCVTSQPKEPSIPEFVVISRKPVLLLCTYCGRYLHQHYVKPSFFKTRKELSS